MLIRRSLLDSEEETAYVCVKRELLEETGVENLHLKYFGVYGEKTTRPSKRPTQLYRFVDKGITKSIYEAAY